MRPFHSAALARIDELRAVQLGVTSVPRVDAMLDAILDAFTTILDLHDGKQTGPDEWACYTCGPTRDSVCPTAKCVYQAVGVQP